MVLVVGEVIETVGGVVSVVLTVPGGGNFQVPKKDPTYT